MILSVVSFTKHGLELSRKIRDLTDICPKIAEVKLFSKWNGARGGLFYPAVLYVKNGIGDWAGEQMRKHQAILFIGACGIAVRAIAPHIQDKLCDSPVLVVDEQGKHVIPILSGHMGGANELAVLLAKHLKAEPVITTATDLSGGFAIDLFAKKNHLAIMNREGIAKVSSRILDGGEITVAVEPGHVCGGDWMRNQRIRLAEWPPSEKTNVLITSGTGDFQTDLLLKPQIYAVGIGCRKGKNPSEVSAWIEKHLRELGITIQEVFALASIDKKSEEACFLEWSRKNRIPFLTFSAEQLQSVSGTFSESEFVKYQMGVGNVCERAAVCACTAGDNTESPGQIVLSRQAENGKTIAVAKRDWSIRLDEG